MNRQTRGTRIASLRRARGMTQLELAEQMCVTDKAVSKWERDLSCPDIASLPRLAEILGTTVEELLPEEVPPSAEKPVPHSGKASVPLICRAIGLAMGVAVTVLAALKKVGLYDGLFLLGIGQTALALTLLRERHD